MPRTKANLKAALKRKIAEQAQKAPSVTTKAGPKRGRLWRTKWLREVRRAQSGSAAGKRTVQRAPFRRLVREIDVELHGTHHRWSDEAIKALQEETENRVTEMLKAANALTITVGRQQTIRPAALRLAATMMGMELPQPKQKLSVLRAAAARAEASAPRSSSDAQTPAAGPSA